MMETVLINTKAYKKPMTAIACDLISLCSECVYNDPHSVTNCEMRKELIEAETKE